MNEKLPELEIINFVDQPDGSTIVEIDISDEFTEWYVKEFELEEWDNEHFNKWFIDCLERAASLPLEHDG